MSAESGCAELHRRYFMSMSLDRLTEEVKKRAGLKHGTDVLETDSEIIEFLLDNCEIELPPQSCFFVKVGCDRPVRSVYYKRAALWDFPFSKRLRSFENRLV